MTYLQSIKERTPNASPSKPNLVPAHSHRGHCRHASGSNGPGGMGAALGAARNGARVALVFDSDLTPLRAAPHPKQLVRAYTVEGCVDGTWKPLATESENVLRHRIHAFETATLSALRVTVTETWGDPSARIFEIRVY